MWSSALVHAAGDPVVFPFAKLGPVAPKRAAIRSLVFVVLGLYAGHRLGGSYLDEWIGAGVGLLLGAAVALYFHRRGRGKKFVPPVMTFSGSRVSLPRSAFGLRADWVAIKDVLSLEQLRGGPGGRLLVSTPIRTYAYPIALLGGDAVVRAIRAELLRRFEAEPEGHALVRAFDEREAASDRLFAHEPRATRIILFVLFAIFAGCSFLGAYDTTDMIDGTVLLIRLGANVPDLVMAGEWFRLVTANLLHGGMIHIGFNALALLGLGYIVERLMGTPRFIVLYLVSGVTGVVASVYLTDGLLSVGASTSVFGVVLAWGYASLRFGRRLPAGFVMTRFQWGVVLLNFALPLLFDFIDGWGHAGGALGGLAVAAILFPTASSFQRAWGSDRMWWAIAAALTGVYVLAVAAAFQRDRNEPYTKTDLLRSVERRARDTAPAQLNAFAWSIAIDSDAGPPDLELANRLAIQAVDRASGIERGAFLDTRATTEYRLGRYGEAVETELRALTEDRLDQRTLWSQLGRFLVAYERAAGERFGTDAVATATVAIQGHALDIRSGSAGTWYFAVDVDGRRAGMAVVTLPDVMNTRLTFDQFPSGGELLPLGTTSTAAAAARAEFHPHDSEVDAYP